MDILYFIDIIGIVSFTISGLLISIKHNLDMLGISLMAFVTALGGGIIRDTIAGKIPYSFVDSVLPMVVLVTLIVSLFLKIHRKKHIERKEIFILSDSIGLISFSVSGALVAISIGANFFGVVILSFITAMGGGIIRDVLINHVPLVLTKDFYGTVAIIVAISMYTLNSFEMLNNISVLIVFILGLMLRIFANKQNWKLPKLK
ncbi:MAG: trimeric intracellular cation channel family protein [Campylobacterota bacterium]|nr:trimeric intracellular cation channel family protein [Campylobacterota bacterium]